MKDFLLILRRNFLSPIVIAILILAGVLLAFNQARDAWFISFVIVFNTLFAIVQEVRAQRALKKLELLNTPRARKLQSDGTTIEVTLDLLKVGDTVMLQTGDEVPADCNIINSSGLEVDESILTGESAAIDKPNGSMVLAASAVMAGTAKAQVVAVGPDTKVGMMTATLKHYAPRPTPLQRAIGRAITWLSYGALLLSAMIITVYYFAGFDPVTIVKAITVAAVTIVPEGLLLASTLLLAFGSLRLTEAKVLPQKLGAIEAMALLNVLCVDKTGTLTSDEVSFESIDILHKTSDPVAALVRIVAKETGGSNATSMAVIDGITDEREYKVNEVLAFSSARKMSGLRVTIDGQSYSILMGAPEFLESIAPLSAKQRNRIETLTREGQRVLLVVGINNPQTSLKKLVPSSGIPLAIVILSNDLRQGVEKTVSYLQNNGVSIRVISGDNPNTVRFVAGKVGIKNADRVTTGPELAQISPDKWDQVVRDTTIFARVLPEQKERLVETFRKFDYFTGMVGDGVNDALAIKKADLGVAMYAGAAATRRVADIVLINNSFNALPLGMKLGNRIMQAIEIIASLFFHKMTYGVVLLLITLSFSVVYPFEPRHVTFMNIFLVTLPTVMWTLFAPLPRHRLSPKYFWQDTLLAIAPVAVITGIVVSMTYGFLRMLHPLDPTGVSTTTVLVATFFGIYLVFLVPRMFDVVTTNKARIARALYVLAVIIVIVPSFGLSFVRDFFDFTTPAWQNTWPLVLLVIAAAATQWFIVGRAGKRFKKRQQ